MIRSNLEMIVNATVRQNHRRIISGEQPGLTVVGRQIRLELHDGVMIEFRLEGSRKLLRLSQAASEYSRDQLFSVQKHGMTSVIFKLMDL